ncbi:glutaminyl-peptide cyclotransferase [Calycina marina]|uniref:Peptide hydrolase n=1 Tax=Calycina marina TaxID=1763456 RepID=A0A9P7YUP1_9HELO|nr:glutaminyl-peptide cyclotransferase [Calycina marina]
MFFPVYIILLHLSLVYLTKAYSILSSGFIRNITSSPLREEFDPEHGTLLAPILVPRARGSEGHSDVQHHFINFFSSKLPRWTLEWHNSTASTPAGKVPINNMVFKREPPWTAPGQANWLTLAAHYDSRQLPLGFIGATDGAVPCAILMHVATVIDGFMTQMHDEMQELGEGGDSDAMDMGVQLVFLDAKEPVEGSSVQALYGSKALSAEWESHINAATSGHHNSLTQISMLVMLDALGSVGPRVPSYLPITHWAYAKMADLEYRMREMKLLESNPSTFFLPSPAGETMQTQAQDDQGPFMNRGVPFLHLLPDPPPENRYTLDNDGVHLEMATVRDWVRIVSGFACEWLDMMEVWPAE